MSQSDRLAPTPDVIHGPKLAELRQIRRCLGLEAARPHVAEREERDQGDRPGADEHEWQPPAGEGDDEHRAQPRATCEPERAERAHEATEPDSGIEEPDAALTQIEQLDGNGHGERDEDSPDEDLRDEVADDERGRIERGDYDSFDAADAAILHYAAKLTADPGSVTKADVDRMRAAGLDDLDILHVNNQTAHLNYTNRVANGLGLLHEIDADTYDPFQAIPE